MSLVIGKALRLIELVAEGQDSLAALVRRSDLSRSTTHRLLSTLVTHGYLSLTERRYELGFRLLELGEKKKRSLAFLDRLQPALRRAAATTRDTIHVAILDGVDIVLIERVAGARELQIRSFVGQRARAFKTAVGKALIARQPPETWSGYLRGIPRDYPKTQAALLADLETARTWNYATDFDEVNIGTCGVASAFRLREGFHAAASINGATVYFPTDRLLQLAETSRALSAQLERAASSESV